MGAPCVGALPGAARFCAGKVALVWSEFGFHGRPAVRRHVFVCVMRHNVSLPGPAQEVS